MAILAMMLHWLEANATRFLPGFLVPTKNKYFAQFLNRAMQPAFDGPYRNAQRLGRFAIF